MPTTKKTTAKKTTERREKGVYLRTDGNPRYELRVRWKDRDTGKTTGLETIRFTFDPKAKPSDTTSRRNALDSANKRAIEERSSLRLYGKPRSALPSAWTLGALLERLLEELDAEEKKLSAQKQKLPKSAQQKRACARMVLGKASEHASQNRGFPDMCKLNLRDVKPEHFSGTPSSIAARLKDRHGNPAGGESVRKVIGFFSQLFQHARSAWGIECANPCADWNALSLPPTGRGRDRTLSTQEWEKVQDALGRTTDDTRTAIYTARFTACRRGEVVALDWPDLSLDDPQQATALLRDTKQKHKHKPGAKPKNREVPLPAFVAEKLIELREKRGNPSRGPVFIGNEGERLKSDSLSQAWSRACARAGVSDAKLHDLRHTRITELGTLLNNPLQVSLISGHDDMNTLRRYFNAKAIELVALLNAKEARGEVASGDAYKTAVQALAKLTLAERLKAVAEATKD